MRREEQPLRSGWVLEALRMGAGFPQQPIIACGMEQTAFPLREWCGMNFFRNHVGCWVENSLEGTRLRVGRTRVRSAGEDWWGCGLKGWNLAEFTDCFCFFFLSRLHVQHRDQCEAWTHNTQIKTWAEIKSQSLNWLSHPGAPHWLFLFFLIQDGLK